MTIPISPTGKPIVAVRELMKVVRRVSPITTEAGDHLTYRDGVLQHHLNYQQARLSDPELLTASPATMIFIDSEGAEWLERDVTQSSAQS